MAQLNYFMLSLSIIISLLSTCIKANPLVSQVCAEARNTSDCNQVLSSAPGASTSDLKGLGYISINIALTNAKQTSPFIEALFKKAADKTLKNKYETCVESYESTIDSLNKSKIFLDKGDISGLRTFASTAFDGASNCVDAFEGPPDNMNGPSDSAEPVKLKDANKKLESLISILLSIGNLLDVKK